MTAGGEQIGGYGIIEELGHGSLATVFLARQLRSHREVALKRVRLDPPDTTLARRLVDELDVVVPLTHPNIASVIECFEYDGMPYVVMEHVPGGSLRRIHRPLAPAQVVGVLEQMLAALARAETERVVHGDLKPENVLLTEDGVIKVADFSIARAYRTVVQPAAARGAPVGTPAYMAPEQALGRADGPGTDLYAVGVMAYEMLGGRLPFGAAASSAAVLARHVHDPVPSLGPRADPALDEWVGRLLAKDPAGRPLQANAAWRDLEGIAVRAAGPHWRFSAALPERPNAAPARLPSSTTRRRLVATVLTVAAVAGVGALVAFGHGSDPPSVPPAETVRRAPTQGIARALRPVIEANRHLATELNALSVPPPASHALAAVASARAATRRASRTDVAPAFAPLLRTEDRYLARVRVALSDPSPGRLDAVSRAASRLRVAFLRLGDALAPGGAASVAGLTRLRVWGREQRRRAPTIEPRKTEPQAVTTAAPAPRIRATATPTSTTTPAPTPTSQTGEPAPSTELPTSPTPGPAATP